MLSEKLEELKQNGNYSVQLWFGEGTGCDDLDVPLNERNLVICAAPVGHLGEIKLLWKGNLDTLKDFNVEAKPTKLPNPPSAADYKENGYYVWGTDRSIEDYLSKFSS